MNLDAASTPIAIPTVDMPGVRRSRPTYASMPHEEFFYETGTPWSFSAGQVCPHEDSCQPCADMAFANLVKLVKQHNADILASES